MFLRKPEIIREFFPYSLNLVVCSLKYNGWKEYSWKEKHTALLMIIFIITFIFLYECVLAHVYQCCVNIRVCALHIGKSGHRQRYCSSLFTLFWTRSVHTGLAGTWASRNSLGTPPTHHRRAGIAEMCCHVQLCICSGDGKSGPHVVWQVFCSAPVSFYFLWASQIAITSK